ncbi:MAG: class I SAM-dependent methyltransferase [Rhizobiaceae bacterium]|nr:class I SAM-dependent methyltransferase [Rhizobiaceae bacterium]
MRVLDLGCGVGDVSLIAGKVVGPSGAVLGIDNALDRIDRAERRATERGLCYWVRFLAAEPDTFMPARRFDAVVIRPPLLRRPDPLAFLGRSGRGVLLLDLDTVDSGEGVWLHAVRSHVGWMQASLAEPRPEPWPLHPPTMGIAQ